MTPIAALSSSVSSVAVATSIAQTAQIIAFPTRAPAPVEVAEDVAPIVVEEIETHNYGNATFERAALARAVDIASEAVEKRNHIPILSNLRIAKRGPNVVLTGTDLDLEINVTIPASVDRGFATTLPADLLKKLLKSAKACDLVSIDSAEDKDSLDFEKATYKLAKFEAEDFPDLVKPEGGRSFTMPGKEFAETLESVRGAVSTEETRYYLNGIFLVPEFDGSLAFVATDGHRLYRQRMAMPEGAEGMEGVIIPRNAVTKLCKLLKGKSRPETVRVTVTDTKISVEFDDVEVVSKTIDGTFPDYMRVVPQNNSHHVTMSSKEMLEAISAVTILSTERGRAVKLEIDNGKCKLVVNDPVNGSAHAEIACDYYGEEITAGFNASYLVDAIDNADGESFCLNIEDHMSPALITGGREEFQAVLMPMRV